MIKKAICYGEKIIDVLVPEKNLAAVLSLPHVPSLPDEEAAIVQAVRHPVGMPPLRELVRPGQKIAFVVDDISRPTPTRKLLPPLLGELAACGIRDADITIVFANGSHRKHTRAEQEYLIGSEYLSRFRVLDHDPSGNDLVSFGNTSRGTPLKINRYVAEADFRILTGLIKPHGYAGYSGGGKSILPGVSGMETIIADHSFQATGHPGSILGEIDGNPIRQDIEEAALCLGPCFILNVILNNRKEIAAVVAGDLIKAHRAGVEKLNAWVKVPVHEEADIVVAGCSHPMSISFYQAINAFSHCVRLSKPIVRKGGTVIVAAPCPEGIGSDGPFYQLLVSAKSPGELLADLKRPGFFRQDQWVAQEYCSDLSQANLVLVSDTIDRETAEKMFADFSASVQEAIDMAIDTYGSRCRITVVPDSPYTLPVLDKAFKTGDGSNKDG